MPRTFALITISLTAMLAFLLGLSSTRPQAPATPEASSPVALEPAPSAETSPRQTVAEMPLVSDRGVSPQPATAGGPVNFADVAESINPAVVNIEAITRNNPVGGRRRRLPDSPPLDESTPAPPGVVPPVRPQSGSGFVIAGDGQILTNYHVIQNAERIVVKFSDGRSLQAHVLGVDPDTDIALIKVDGQHLPAAPLGNSETLRVGEWVCAIGNPLAYEHTVTVGVVSYLGRKLFDTSLDNYIQTDAAINFGNSGGPLINGRGEVVGINSAISQRASNIGFAVPINEAKAILPQLKAEGRVARGFMGVVLTDVDPDLQRSLRLTSTRGALVQDVTEGSPGNRAGLRTYDLITSIDNRRVANNDEIIREVSRRAPGTLVRLQILRDGQSRAVTVRLAERPSRQAGRSMDDASPSVRPSSNAMNPLGLGVRDIDRATARRLNLPGGMTGVIVTRVEPMGSAHDAGIQRDHVVMEINRRPIGSVEAYNRMARAAHAGEVLALYVYMPGRDQRAIRAIRVDGP